VALTWADLEERVQKLTRDFRDSGDRIYSVTCVCGVLLGTTKVGRHRGKQKGVGQPILKQIPRQLKIEGPLWRDIVACSKARGEYIVARGHAGCLSEGAVPAE
jgi:hypothetical protein